MSREDLIDLSLISVVLASLGALIWALRRA